MNDLQPSSHLLSLDLGLCSGKTVELLTAKLPNLSDLSFENNGDVNWSFLQNCRHLKSLAFSGCFRFPSKIDYFKRGLDYFSVLQQLTDLDLRSTYVGDRVLCEIVERLPVTLQRFSHHDFVSLRLIEVISARFPRLKDLNVSTAPVSRSLSSLSFFLKVYARWVNFNC